MSTTKESPPNLAAIVHASEQAAAEAAAAQARAIAAQAKADRAKEEAEQQRHAALERHVRHLEVQYPTARDQATLAIGEARSALEDAVRTGTDVFGPYRQWTDAQVTLWALERALADAKGLAGRSFREPSEPAFNFAANIGGAVDQASHEAMDQALERIREARAAFLAGRESA